MLPPNFKDTKQIKSRHFARLPNTIKINTKTRNQNPKPHFCGHNHIDVVLLPFELYFPISMEANKENIIPRSQKPRNPFRPIPPSSKMAVKRKLRKPLADITHLCQPTDGCPVSVSVSAACHSRKRKSFRGGESGVPLQIASSKSLRMGFR